MTGRLGKFPVMQGEPWRLAGKRNAAGKNAHDARLSAARNPDDRFRHAACGELFSVQQVRSRPASRSKEKLAGPMKHPSTRTSRLLTLRRQQTA